jgi:hypothetical protein
VNLMGRSVHIPKEKASVMEILSALPNVAIHWQ